MKLLFFDDYKLGVLKGDAVVDVSDVVKDIPHTGPGDLINGLIARWADYKGEDRGRRGQGRGKPPGRAVRIRPPLPKPANIVCMAVNYMEDGTRTEPAPINAFHEVARRPSSAPATRWCCPTCRPRSSRARRRWRSSSASAPSHVPRRRAMELHLRLHELHRRLGARPAAAGNTFYQMKSRDTFAPIGPCIVTADEIADPHKLAIKLSVNGTVEAELQHRRHGAQDPALHRVGQLDPRAGAGRHPRHRHQPPRAHRLHGRRHGRAGDARAWARCASR